MDAHTLDVLQYKALAAILESHAPTELGRRVVRRMRPARERGRVALAQKQVNEARHLLDLGEGLPTARLKDMMGPLRRAHKRGLALEPRELLLCREMLLACAGLAHFLERRRKQAPTLAGLGDRLRDHGGLVRAIEQVVEQPGIVRDDASLDLAAIRARQRLLEEELRALMTSLTHLPRLRPYLRERSFSVRNGRYVLPVILDKKGYVPGLLLDRSSSGNTAFVEPVEAAVFSNELEDLRLRERREVSRLLLALSRRLYQAEEELAHTQQIAAWLDFTAARALMSADLDLRPAEISEEPVILLREARHPLLLKKARDEGREQEVVPCSLELGRTHSMLVITGPNTGGKTVTLKTVGLLQLMFQSGLHLPVAAGTRLPVLKGILVDIGDEQSLLQSLSTFSGHVRNIAHILDRAAPEVLVLLDELGAGTDPAEGAALGQAILEHLRSSHALCMVTTHLGMLKTYGFTHSGVENACVAFDPETLHPTYQLLVGQPGNSNALIIAARHGIPKALIREAEGLILEESQETRDLVEQLVVSRVASEEMRRRSEEVMAESCRKLREAESALAEALAAREKLELEAESEVSRVLEAFLEEARPHLNALRNVPKPLQEHRRRLEELMAERLHTMSFKERRRAFLRKVKRYDKVYIPRFEQVGTVVKLNRAEERLLVRLGGVSMEIAFDDVSWVTPPPLDSDQGSL